ncbi:hypothetical protein [Amycolatopsis sp. EV170708-02-1]|uniref:hypothetical protein n=1 Tax=Amycolatopsis sp. EV170708-02-1 TaxID=2919322 RepID=UPI001F0C2CBA|nr:hypothetical protein [Amycolatopsis sp. EV170708-02-1]UMP03706.1 hypothetical protein MJQ72_02135 [Amycolatopsis sp. EV170708-02-1]
MKRLFSVAMAIAALGFTTACGGTSAPRDTAPGDLTTDSGITTETAPTATSEPPPTGPGPTKDSPPPGVVPGSPIRYNSDLLGTDPATAKDAIEQHLERLCKSSRRCGVSVEIVGEGKCIREIGPNPVQPGKTIKIRAKACETETTEESSAPPKPESTPPSETTGG